MKAKLTLTIVKGPQANRILAYEQHDTLVLGRFDECDICLPDDQAVSRHHFLLEANPPHARLRDLGSRNGTYVNGMKYGGRLADETPEQGARREYPQVDLRDGDEIRVGDTILRVSIEVPAQPPKPVRCQNCGQDVSAELGAGAQGDYVCEACRRKAEANPSALLDNLLNQAAPRVVGAPNIPDYDFVRKLGQGGMGAVYLVRDKRTRGTLALKVMVSQVAVDDAAARAFLREIEQTRLLQHRNIIQFLGQGAAGGMFYFLMEYCELGSADAYAERHGGRLKLAEAGPIMLQALNGLAYAHHMKTVHRDLKPANILLSGSEDKPVAKVSDFGLAKNFERAGFSGMTATGSFGGSLPFMPREQLINFKHELPVSDVWAMGASFYFLLTRQLPRVFKRGQDPVQAILEDQLVPVRKRDPSVPASVAEVIDRALSSKVEERYQDAREMHQALEKVL